MGDPAESNPDDSGKDSLGLGSSRVKPPNKKKHDEEMERVNASIREHEIELKLLAPSNNDLRVTRSEKTEHINRIKAIELEVKALNQEINKKKASLDRLQCNLHYKNEERIDESIRNLEYFLKRENFKLSKEKKIVAEIDSLKRSKKVLREYLTIKKENDSMRDRLRHLREERDRVQKIVNDLRRKEEQIKSDAFKNKQRREILKKELDVLYESRRQLNTEYKQMEKCYVDNKEEKKKLKRKESFKVKEETHMEVFQKSIKEFTVHCEPYVDEINLCNALINYNNKFTISAECEAAVDDTSLPNKPIDLSASSSSTELEEGMYVLKKKCDQEDSEYNVGKRPAKRRSSKKGRKPSVTKPITHSPQIFSQFASLNLSAPSNLSEIPASLEQLYARKQYYMEDRQTRMQAVAPTIEEHHVSDAEISNSDAGISLTESGMCEMSRQASNTESTENPAESVPLYVFEELVKVSSEEAASETMSEKSEDTLGRSNSNSDSTTHSEGDNSDTSVKEQGVDRTTTCDKCGRKRNSSFDSLSEESCVADVTETVPDKVAQTIQAYCICKPDSNTKIHNLNPIVKNKNSELTSGSKFIQQINDDCQEDYEFDLPEQKEEPNVS